MRAGSGVHFLVAQVVLERAVLVTGAPGDQDRTEDAPADKERQAAEDGGQAEIGTRSEKETDPTEQQEDHAEDQSRHRANLVKQCHAISTCTTANHLFPVVGPYGERKTFTQTGTQVTIRTVRVASWQKNSWPGRFEANIPQHAAQITGKPDLDGGRPFPGRRGGVPGDSGTVGHTGQLCWTVTLLIFTSSTGRSWAPVATEPIVRTTSRLASSAVRPKAV